MGQVVEPNHIAYFRYLFLRVFQQFASGVQAVLRDELREGHPLASLEISAERRAAHARFRSDVVQRDSMDVVRHDVCRDLLYPPHIPLDADRVAGERMIRRRKNDRQQAEHFA